MLWIKRYYQMMVFGCVRTVCIHFIQHPAYAQAWDAAETVKFIANTRKKCMKYSTRSTSLFKHDENWSPVSKAWQIRSHNTLGVCANEKHRYGMLSLIGNYAISWSRTSAPQLCVNRNPETGFLIEVDTATLQKSDMDS